MSHALTYRHIPKLLSKRHLQLREFVKLPLNCSRDEFFKRVEQEGNPIEIGISYRPLKWDVYEKLHNTQFNHGSVKEIAQSPSISLFRWLRGSGHDNIANILRQLSSRQYAFEIDSTGIFQEKAVGKNPGIHTVRVSVAMTSLSFQLLEDRLFDRLRNVGVASHLGDFTKPEEHRKLRVAHYQDPSPAFDNFTNVLKSTPEISTGGVKVVATGLCMRYHPLRYSASRAYHGNISRTFSESIFRWKHFMFVGERYKLHLKKDIVRPKPEVDPDSVVRFQMGSQRFAELNLDRKLVGGIIRRVEGSEAKSPMAKPDHFVVPSLTQPKEQ